MKLVRSPGRVAVDTEGTGLYAYLGDRPFTFQTCDENLTVGFWRAPVNPFTREVSWAGLPGPWAVLRNPNVAKIFHNAKHDIQASESIGQEVVGRIEDTMLMVKVLHSGRKAGLKDLGNDWLGIPKDDEEALHNALQAARAEGRAQGWRIADDSGRWGDEPEMADFWLPQLAELLERYARLDPERTMLLFHLLNPMLDADARLRGHYELELRLLRTVMAMERRGVRCDRRQCGLEISKAKLHVYAHNAQLEAGLKEIGFSPRKRPKKQTVGINPNSPVQVRELIYEKLGFVPKIFTDSGQPSTSSKALQRMNHPLINHIASAKLYTKAQSFFNNYLLHAVPDGTGVDVVHPQFSQVMAATFRFSCKAPNLQQVPDNYSRYGFEALQARTVFGPRPGYIWLHVDWSQIQMWIFAAECGDPAMMADLMSGSLHEATANRVFGAMHGDPNIVETQKKQGSRKARTDAKMLNFGVVFCMGEETTADYLGVSRREAKKYRDFYYQHYSRIRPFMDSVIARAQLEGCVWNRYGWRLEVDKEMAYRGVNYIVQSEEAAHVKQKMIWLDDYYRANKLDAHLVLTNHDEIVTECHELEIRPHLQALRAELESHHGVFPEFPSLPIEFKVTRDKWAQQEKLSI